ncbi:MAG: hypothetical protein U5L00_05185 [Desulfovermiculus sp.]|nr:hypothetical protein [Desulfovermiculus sp.]
MIDYTIYYKDVIHPNEPFANKYDLFVSAFNLSERVQHVFSYSKAKDKWWLVHPEYEYAREKYHNEKYYDYKNYNEAFFIKHFFKQLECDVKKLNLCIDITGFMRPHLMFLIRYLLSIKVSAFDIIYSEPERYQKDEQTKFSEGAFTGVRQVAGYEGQHNPETHNDLLIIGTGYDTELISNIAESKNNSKKIQLFGLPSLRPHMYQENVLNASYAAEAIGSSQADELIHFYSPANDPFITAQALNDKVKTEQKKRDLSNLYLSPLGTKVQTLGFALYYIHQCINTNTSMIFPFRNKYSQETSKGISRIWRYRIELNDLCPSYFNQSTPH